jgi:hypothetical protein
MVDPLYTYNFVCMKDRSEMNIELSTQIGYKPKCLKCGGYMILRYSIDDSGELYMNDDILND